jgi:uncharacterized protein
MFVGVARFVLQIPGARTLKQRRQVVKSCKDRLRARLPLSVAEVGDAGRLQLATLGVAVISGDATRCDQILASALRMLSALPEAVLADVRTERINMGEDGKGVRFGIDAPPDSMAGALRNEHIELGALDETADEADVDEADVDHAEVPEAAVVPSILDGQRRTS